MSEVRRVPFGEVQVNELGGGSTSRLLLTTETVGDNQACLGYSHFPPRAVTQSVVHDTEELVFVVKGRGELKLDDGAAPFEQHDALYIPPHVRHAVANTGEEDVIMVFMFPHPEYPPTKYQE